MYTSYLDAKTFGIGQLITQRKKLIVPEHQRDFSWTLDDVSQFISDIINALQTDAVEYFIGLIVVLGPRENAWSILDGQQRLATTTMIYSAIRQWLSERGYDADERQIDSEFLRARQLGGEYSPRLTLNAINNELFWNLVIRKSPVDDIDRQIQNTSKYSSNRLLLEAAKYARDCVNDYAQSDVTSPDDQKRKIFQLSSFLENRVECVVLDVALEKSAYIIFESLNARGNKLSALDLVKNYAFSLADSYCLDEIRTRWSLMSDRIEEKDADDFLKTFWTSRFGRVQLPYLYDKIKEKYKTSEEVVAFVTELSKVADYYLALDDPSHEIWNTYGPECSNQIEIISILGSKQVRAPIISAIEQFSPELMSCLLRALIVLTVRYQIVGKRRTGVLEIALARMANRIYECEISSSADIWKEIKSLVPNNDDFTVDFMRFADKKASRLIYFLNQLEIVFRRKKGLQTIDLEKAACVQSNIVLDNVIPKQLFPEFVHLDKDEVLFWQNCIGNKCIIEQDNGMAKFQKLQDRIKSHTKSSFLLTSGIPELVSDHSEISIVDLIVKRQRQLATLAVEAWPLE